MLSIQYSSSRPGHKPALIRDYPEAFLRLFYPADCALCQDLLGISDKNLCSSCRLEMKESSYSLSEACSSRTFEYLDEAWALYPYESRAGKILSSVKFFRKQWLLGIFFEELSWLSDVLCTESSYDALVPVPIDRLRLFEREFNQAELIARLVSKHTGVPITRNLRKTRRTFTQSGLGKQERQINLFQAFGLRRPSAVFGKTFLLIDDILTTGATGEETARILKNHGARRVDLLTIARTEDRREVQP